MADADQTWRDAILSFWFDEVGPQQWFTSDPTLDEAIRRRFLATHEAIAADFDLAANMVSPRQALATVIVLDQLPRNLFRGTPRAFATDPLALLVAAEAVGRGLDRALEPPQRMFLYLPFEHSEAIADQDRSVELIGSLGDARWLAYAHAHRDIIARFGRFPHRNAINGLASTSEEQAFLQQPDSSF